MLVPQRPINKIVNGTNKNLNLKEEMFSDKKTNLKIPYFDGNFL